MLLIDEDIYIAVPQEVKASRRKRFIASLGVYVDASDVTAFMKYRTTMAWEGSLCVCVKGTYVESLFFSLELAVGERSLATLLPSQSQQSIRLPVRFKAMVRREVRDSVLGQSATLLGLVHIVGRLARNWKECKTSKSEVKSPELDGVMWLREWWVLMKVMNLVVVVTVRVMFGSELGVGLVLMVVGGTNSFLNGSSWEVGSSGEVGRCGTGWCSERVTCSCCL